MTQFINYQSNLINYNLNVVNHNFQIVKHTYIYSLRGTDPNFLNSVGIIRTQDFVLSLFYSMDQSQTLPSHFVV